MRDVWRIFVPLGLLITAAATPATAADVDAQAAFEQLKSLAGSWHGVPEAEGEEAAAEAELVGTVTHEIRVSAAGTVVMETMSPGTSHEMINMYYLDGDDLVLTHYCASGNQPAMRMDPARSTKQSLVFDFSGGTNLDPAVDEHIHSATITWQGADRIDSAWIGYGGGKPAGTMVFHLERGE